MRFFILALSLWITTLGLGADSASKEQLVRVFRVDHESPLEALVLERFVTINASPEWWTLLLDSSGSRGSNLGYRLSNMCRRLPKLANSMGLGDLEELNKADNYKASSPLVLGMLDEWKGKISVEFRLMFVPNAETSKKVIENLERVTQNWDDPNYLRPRGRAFHAVLHVDPKARASSCKVSKDGTRYDFVVPVYADVNGSEIEKALKSGR